MPMVEQSSVEKRRRNFSWWERLKRASRFKLVIPLKRSVHAPEHIARGVAVGLAWALTPTVGIQMAFCFVTWVIARRIFKWDFHLLVSLAWTWFTNVITLLPSYYLFFLTGQLMLGRFDDLSGYNEFILSYDKNVAAAGLEGYWEGLWISAVLLFEGWGIPMLIGCLPWAALGSWGGYVWSLKLIKRYRESSNRQTFSKSVNK